MASSKRREDASGDLGDERPGSGPATGSRDFIREIIDEHNRTGRFGGRVHTRFPAEPNGYLHIGHAKSICLNYGIAAEFGGLFNLRMDDTNPEKEEQEYVDSIIDSVGWLGFDFGPEPLYASDYFDFMYRAAEYLITAGHAYVDSQSAEEMRENRGTLTSPGMDSPFRGRSVEENLRLGFAGRRDANGSIAGPCPAQHGLPGRQLPSRSGIQAPGTPRHGAAPGDSSAR